MAVAAYPGRLLRRLTLVVCWWPSAATLTKEDSALKQRAPEETAFIGHGYGNYR